MFCKDVLRSWEPERPAGFNPAPRWAPGRPWIALAGLLGGLGDLPCGLPCACVLPCARPCDLPLLWPASWAALWPAPCTAPWPAPCSGSWPELTVATRLPCQQYMTKQLTS